MYELVIRARYANAMRLVEGLEERLEILHSAPLSEERT